MSDIRKQIAAQGFIFFQPIRHFIKTGRHCPNFFRAAHLHPLI